MHLATAILAVGLLAAGCSTRSSAPGGLDGGNVSNSSGPLGPAQSLSAGSEPTDSKNRAGLSTALSRAGNTAASGGNYATAVKMFERAHRLAPNRIEPALGLARAASAVKDHEKAADAYRAVLKIDRDHPDALAGLGRELMTLKEPREAIPYLERALKQRRVAWVHNELGVAYESVGDFPTALGEYQAGLELSPRDLTLRTNLGRALAWAGDYDAATEILRVAGSDPNATRRHRQVLSLVHALAGNTQSAAEITRIDYSRAETENKLSYYRLVADMARSEDRDAVAKVLADTALRSVSTSPGDGNRAVAFAARNRALAHTDSRKPIRRSADTRAADGATSTASSRSTRPTNIAKAASSTRKRTAASSKNQRRSSRGSVHRASTRPMMQTEPPGAKGPFAYTVQLAAFRTTKRTEKGWRILNGQIPELLSPLSHMIRPPNPDFKWDTLFRLRTLAFVARGPAEQLCSSIKSRGLECLVVQTKITKTLKFEEFGKQKVAKAVKAKPSRRSVARNTAGGKGSKTASKTRGKTSERTVAGAKTGKTGSKVAAPAKKPESDSERSSRFSRLMERFTGDDESDKDAVAKGSAKRDTKGVKRSASDLAKAIPDADIPPGIAAARDRAAPGTYQVQLAAYRSVRGAETGWRSLQKTAPDLLGGIAPAIIDPEAGAKSTFYRLRTAAFEDRLDAVRLCARLRARNIDCIVVRSGGDGTGRTTATLAPKKKATPKPSNRDAFAEELSKSPL